MTHDRLRRGRRGRRPGRSRLSSSATAKTWPGSEHDASATVGRQIPGTAPPESRRPARHGWCHPGADPV